MARYHEVADAVRQQIVSGELAANDPLPSADTIAHQHGVGRDTALKALKVLRREGLLVLGRDNTMRVAPGPPRPSDAEAMTLVDVPAHAVVRARMPTPWERDELGLADGVPVLVVRIGEDEEVHPAAGTAMRWPLGGG
ncbi:GntR family transcriptional regulator [Dactylosporangium sp. CA-139066]|uniref:GntR family transcriptional regulator n=1 Tax=Dactylosporangium sp. CA-139066 TaxID=3239930 RepID=UPI003D8EFD98